MRRLPIVALLVTLAHSCELIAGSVEVTVKDISGAAVPDAVVYAKGNGIPSVARKQVIIDQRDKQFVPYVTALQVGTAVFFPNKDNIRHHVYSFSTAKKFELPLYSGVPAEPVLFDKEGFVTLGCNIHDWMIAYVAVLPTPYFHVTGADGLAYLKDLPAGHYSVSVWQPALKGPPQNFIQTIDISASGTKELLFNVELKADFRVRRAPGLSSGGYR
jgi:plastocyanin